MAGSSGHGEYRINNAGEEVGVGSFKASGIPYSRV